LIFTLIPPHSALQCNWAAGVGGCKYYVLCTMAPTLFLSLDVWCVKSCNNFYSLQQLTAAHKLYNKFQTERVCRFDFVNGATAENCVSHVISRTQVPRLTHEQLQAIELFEELAGSDHLAMHMALQPGDLQLLNNHTMLHTRSEFKDHPVSCWFLRWCFTLDDALYLKTSNDSTLRSSHAALFLRSRWNLPCYSRMCCIDVSFAIQFDSCDQ